MTSTDTTAPADAKSTPLIPPSLKAFFDVKPVLWYEDDERYSILVGEVLSELDPQDTIAFLLCKDVADYIWEIERIKRLRRDAIHAEIPDALWNIIAVLYYHKNKVSGRYDSIDSYKPAFKARVRLMLIDTEERRAEFAAFLGEYNVEPGILHYAAFERASAVLASLEATRERAERRRDQMLQGFTDRKHSLAAQARSLIAQHEAVEEGVDIVSPGTTN